MKKSIEISSQLRQLLATLMLTLIISPSAMSEGIYKWTDENGKVHYGSQRPEDAKAEKMNLYVPKPASQPESQKDIDEKNPEGEQTQETKPKDHDTPEAANKERTAYCANERKRLQTIENNEEIHEEDASGKINKLSSDARNKRLAKIRANIAKYCK
ncbi:MAG: DUF4124 domain-containing protein [Gammaproteobacteria bacterium]|nr:DUF4124 domain-containing protein [Gammaproteobacteria bacterium]MCW8923206.1 DUF4124 domain-containing protein [Gammaproteobacteria bacterium]